MPVNSSRSRPCVISGFSEGAAASPRHPSANDPSSCDARMNTTSRIEGDQGYAQPPQAYDDYQQSQAQNPYVPHVALMYTDTALSSASGLGFHQVPNQLHIVWPQHPYQGTDASSNQIHDHPQTQATSDDQYSAIGGQFNPSIGLTGLVQDQQGSWTTEDNVQGFGEMMSDGSTLTDSYDVPPIAREDAQHHADCPNAHTSQLGSIEDQEQSMFMVSLGRQPGYQEALVRAMSDDPRSQMPYSSANGTNISPHAAAGDMNTAGVFQCQKHGPYPSLPQDSSGNGIVPGIVVEGPGDLKYWQPELRASSIPVIQQTHRSDPRLPGRSTPSSSSVVIGDVLRCPHEGCKAEFKKSWSRGNLGRHLRNKHKNGGRSYHCEAHGCASVFQRSDARLKHYRKKHRELMNTHLRPRKASSSTGSGSAFEGLGGSQYSNSLASPSGSQALDDFEMASCSCDIDNESCHDSSFQVFS